MIIEFEKEREKEEERIAQKLSSALGLTYFDLSFQKPEIDALKIIPQEIAKKSLSIPLKKTGKNILLGVVDPYSTELSNLKDSLEKQGFKVSLAIISPRSFEIGLGEYKYLKDKKISYLKTFEVNPEVISEIQKEIKRKEDLEYLIKKISVENPFLIFDYLLAGALKFNASDIHFEPKEKNVLIRYRIDGILYDIFSFPKNIYQLLKNRIKVLSGLMINITDKPQDGRFSIFYNNENVDLRVSIIPTFEDEAIVFRILIFSQVKKDLEEIGLREDDLEILNRNIHRPNGLILNTGPTGSGKTTTLYSIIMKIKKPELKIITIENPVEYKIEGITQTQIDERRGFNFADALRAYLRHDPDIILVGEIRDEETAQIAAQASLTGHLVLSTLHTNDSLGAIPRLISLNVDPKLIPPALRLIIAQRLVRKICNFCKEEYEPSEEIKNKIKSNLGSLPPRVKIDINLENFTLAKGKGCENCFYSGYQGRIGIFELLEMDPNLEKLIYKKPSEAEIYESIKGNFVSLKQDALIKALLKITTLEEVERVVGLI